MAKQTSGTGVVNPSGAVAKLTRLDIMPRRGPEKPEPAVPGGEMQGERNMQRRSEPVPTVLPLDRGVE